LYRNENGRFLELEPAAELGGPYLPSCEPGRDVGWTSDGAV